MPCVAVEETLAEKVISFLRRHAEHRAGVREKWDQALVRHIYDTYCIVGSKAALFIQRRPTSRIASNTTAESFTITPRLSKIRSNP